MANIDEAILGKRRLNGKKEEEQAGYRMDQDRTEKRTGASVSEKSKGNNLNEMRKQAAKVTKGGIGMGEEAKMKIGSKITGGARKGTAHLLKAAWLNLIDSFGLTLIYINLHVFGRSVFGERIFCDLGEEWIPDHLRSSLESDKVKSRIRRIGLAEKIVLIFLDLLVLFCLLGIIVIIAILVDLSLGGIMKIVAGAAWEGLKSFFTP